MRISFLLSLILLIYSNNCISQDGISINVGTAFFQAMKVVSNENPSIINTKIYPSPFIEIGYSKSLNNKKNLKLSFSTIGYIQRYSIKPSPDIDFYPFYDEFITRTSYKLELVMEQLIADFQKSNLHIYYGIGLQHLKLDNSISGTGYIDTINLYVIDYENKNKIQPSVALGLKYQIKTKNQNFWQFGLGLNYALTKRMGKSTFEYNHSSQNEEGNFYYRGSHLLLKMGFHFTTNKKSRESEQ